MAYRSSSTWGFKQTGKLLSGQIRRASESRGFAQSKVLTHWAEIAGADMAAIARPVDVTFSRGAMGATLTLLTTGANAPMLDMQKEQLRNKVNAVYGYNAIARIRITQTAATGFAEGQVDFSTRKTHDDTPVPVTKHAETLAAPIGDAGLRAALERLGTNIESRTQKRKTV
jgi:hypothetical protein